MNLFRNHNNPSKGTSPNGSGWKIMYGVDDFSTHMAKKENATLTQRLMNRAGVTESRKDDQRFEEDLAKLDASVAIKLLEYINGSLTGAKKGERRTTGYGVWGGAEISGHLSPAPDVQELAMEETFDAIKNDIKDNHKRAALAYYMINHLHLFGDGNGRTARTMYEVFDKQDFNIAGENFFHKTNDDAEVSTNRERFAEERGLQPTATAASISLDLVKKDMAKDLPGVFMNTDCSLNLPTGNRPMPDVYFTKDAAKNLPYIDKKIVRTAFFEKPIATLALGKTLKEKGTDYWAIDESTVRRNGKEFIRFGIENKDGDVAKTVFDGWTANDYKNFCKTVKGIQLQQARKMIDIFKNEDKYKMEDGRTYADWLSGEVS